MPTRVARDDRSAAPQLRFDKVARRLVRGVRRALEVLVPDGVCVLFAVSAPIRQPSNTTQAIVEMVRPGLSAETVRGERHGVLFENEVRLRIVPNPSRPAVRVAGFVHNPHPSPNALLDVAQALLAGAPDASGQKTLRGLCEQAFASSDDAAVIEHPTAPAAPDPTRRRTGIARRRSGTSLATGRAR